jgi:acetylornithine deacetylase
MDQSVIERTLRHIDAQGLVDLASNLIRIPSFSPEETPAARFLAEYFRSRGYEVEMQEVEPGRFQTIATLRGTGGGKSLMFNGHLDINSLKLGARRDPWTPTVEGDRLYGHGGENMKGGVATMITAAQAIRTAGIRLRGDLVIACVVGETQGGEGTHHLVQSGLRTDMAILPEPYGIEHLVTIHGGIVHLAIHTYGITGHLSQLEKTVNAVLKMAKVVEALPGVRFTYAPHPELPALPRLNVGSVIGGRGARYVLHEPPYVPDLCTTIVDVHFVPGQTVDGIVADIRRALDRLTAEDPQLRYEIEIPPPAFFKGRRRLVMQPIDVPREALVVQTVARSHERVLGRPPATIGAILPMSYSAGDRCWLWGAHPLPLLRTPRRLPRPGPGRRLHVHQRDGRLRQGPRRHRPGGLRVAEPPGPSSRCYPTAELRFSRGNAKTTRRLWRMHTGHGHSPRVGVRPETAPLFPPQSGHRQGEILIADVPIVQVTSEEVEHPIDNAFDHNRGPEGSCSIAA